MRQTVLPDGSAIFAQSMPARLFDWFDEASKPPVLFCEVRESILATERHRARLLQEAAK